MADMLPMLQRYDGRRKVVFACTAGMMSSANVKLECTAAEKVGQARLDVTFPRPMVVRMVRRVDTEQALCDIRRRRRQ